MSAFYSKHFITSIYSIFCVFFLCAPSITFAAVYSVSPLLIDKELEKRDIITENITITNKESHVLRIFPTVNEVSVNEGGTIKGFLEPSMIANKETSITSWLEIGRGRIELQPGETKEVPLTIRVNPQVEAGEYHAFIGFPTGGNRPEAEKIVYGGTSPGTLVRISVDKVQNQFLRLESFSVKRFVRNTDTGEISFTLLNPGDDPVVPKGEIIFYDNRGTEMASVTINDEQKTINSKQEVMFTNEVPESLKMGKYKAFLTVEYGEHQTASLNDTAFFYVLPFKQLIIIFVIILVLAILIALYIHRKYDTMDKDDGVAEVALYIRNTKSESKDHDIDLSKKNIQ